MTSSSGDIPASRLGRTARIGGLAASQTAKYAGTRAANVTRPRHQRKLAIERRHLQAADQILAVLGTMKGPAMKIGQLLSFVDLGLLPKDVRPHFQRRLATLCDAAPQIPFETMEPVLAASLGTPVTTVFRDFDPAPIGIASIGQVYRATTLDGRDVAVKVQYPKIVAAAKADLKNLSILLRFAKGLAPSVDMHSLGAELTGRFLEELDYTREAASHRELADAFAGHPFIVVPAPVEELCGPQVIVTEFVEGADFDGLRARPPEDRDRAGEILVRFYFGSLFHLGRFSGDPHPGNLKLLPDGRLAFFDFGSFKVLDERMLGIVRGTLRAVAEGRGADAVSLLADEGILFRPDRVGAEQALGYFYDTCGWFLEDEALTMTPRVASEAILQSLAPATDYREEMRGQDLPVEWALLVRTVVSAMALLGQLTATANWHRIAREWVYGDPPATELGQLEADFFARPRGD
jgi:predicted unusual protein kinase regulating ubiquinone biosynthesis (AarF/ABC1/UbiB family)